MMLTCAGCDRPILDRFLLNVLDCVWHIKCVQCCDCNSNLTDKCFAREGKIYCRADFFRRFGTKCAGCSQGISPNDLVRRARNKVFHLKCFTCMVCRKQLSTGEELYVLDENKFICKDDYMSSRITGSDGEDDMDLENSLENSGHLSDGDNSLDSKDDLMTTLNNNNTYNNNNSLTTNNNNSLSPLPQSPSLIPSSDIKEEPMNEPPDTPVSFNNDVKSEKLSNDTTNSGNSSGSEQTGDTPSCNANTPGAKRRGPRTTIKAKQLETLKAAFNATPKPTRHIREQLAQETGLNMRVIQVWFQNRRSKERRMKQLSALGARRHFFRNPRRMRAIRAGMSPHELDDSPEMMGPPGFPYFAENGQEFYPGYQGYGDFYPGQVPGDPLGYSHTPPMMDQPLHPNSMESQFLPGDILPTSSTPEPMPMHESLYAHRLSNVAYQPGGMQLPHHPPVELTSDTW